MKTYQIHALKYTRDHNDADDLLQEAKLKALKNQEKFKPGTNLKAWLFTIMKNSFITNYQKKVRRNTFVDTTDNFSFINHSESNTTRNKGVNNIADEEIKQAIQSLEDNFKTPFMMHFKGFKYHEIAAKLSIPIGTVKNRIHVARHKLKEQLYVYQYGL